MSETQSADERLREAAEVLRERAEKATPGPWAVDDHLYPETIYGSDSTAVVSGSRWSGGASVFNEDADAEWIATMHPGVGLALADLMEEAGRDFLVLRGYASEHLVTIADLILADLPGSAS